MRMHKKNMRMLSANEDVVRWTLGTPLMEIETYTLKKKFILIH